jgi:hypothetical protein
MLGLIQEKIKGHVYENKSKLLLNNLEQTKTREREEILRAMTGWRAGEKGAESGSGGL